MIKDTLKSKVLESLARARENFTGSDSRFAVSIGVNPAQYSRIKRGDVERVLSEAQWITLARRLNVSLTGAPEWKTAETDVYRFIWTQLEACQNGALSNILCDLSDVGKTYAARRYAETHKQVAYIDCSQHKTRSSLVRAIAQSFGAGHTGIYSEVYKDLVFYLKTLTNPLIILDEAGDLEYEAFLEIKALWNATELACGFYMIGADGLKAKIQRAIDNHRVGYTEIFSRFGRRYGTVVPLEKEERDNMLRSSAIQIIKANSTVDKDDAMRMLRRTIGDDGAPSLRRIYKEITKLKLV